MDVILKKKKLSLRTREYQQHWRLNREFIPFHYTIKLYQYIASFDYKTENIINSRLNATLTRLISKRYGTQSSVSNMHICNWSSHSLTEIKEFVLKHRFEFCVPPSKINKEMVFSEFVILFSYLVDHIPRSSE